jgi:hypothetical protein
MNTKIRATLLALALLTALLTTLFSQGESLADSSQEMAVRRALLWLRTRQQPDGSIPNIVSDAYNGTNQAVLAIVAGNQDPHTWLSSNNLSPMDYLAGQAITQTDTITETGTTARLTLAVVAAGEDPYHFGGVNLVGRLQSYHDPVTGQYGLAGDVVAQSLSMLAVSAAVTDTQLITQTVPTTATNLLKSWQQASGGWNIAHPCACAAPTWCCPATGADIDATGLAIQALIAAGEPPTSAVLADASNYLANQQQNDGGWDTFGLGYLWDHYRQHQFYRLGSPGYPGLGRGSPVRGVDLGWPKPYPLSAESAAGRWEIPVQPSPACLESGLGADHGAGGTRPGR